MVAGLRSAIRRPMWARMLRGTQIVHSIADEKKMNHPARSSSVPPPRPRFSNRLGCLGWLCACGMRLALEFPGSYRNLKGVGNVPSRLRGRDGGGASHILGSSLVASLQYRVAAAPQKDDVLVPAKSRQNPAKPTACVAPWDLDDLDQSAFGGWIAAASWGLRNNARRS